jgi:hypothetical protein
VSVIVRLAASPPVAVKIQRFCKNEGVMLDLSIFR